MATPLSLYMPEHKLITVTKNGCRFEAIVHINRNLSQDKYFVGSKKLISVNDKPPLYYHKVTVKAPTDLECINLAVELLDELRP